MTLYIHFKAIINAVYLQHPACLKNYLDHTLGDTFSVVTFLVTKVNRSPKLTK